ncbi:hypothetical protein [Neptunicella sp. SCSIO 80796]|uniref:hypothetical protein n=1 Tax=Neptunicella plasticusilytica TaxID=3117012 RepID=UPI003A4D8337
MNRIFLFLIISLFCHSAIGQNYLEPIPPFDRTSYNEALLESFIDNKDPELWMIVKPSFELPYAIILYSQSGKYYLTSVEAKEDIWKYKKVENYHVLDIEPTKNVDIKSSSFKHDELQEVLESWRSGLKLTRYSSKKRLGKDGTTYMFYSKNRLYGQTWSPEGGLALNFVKLGETLRQLVFSSDENKEKLLIQAHNLAKNIREYSPKKS